VNTNLRKAEKGLGKVQKNITNPSDHMEFDGRVISYGLI
jgi:hypothetical protein